MMDLVRRIFRTVVMPNTVRLGTRTTSNDGVAAIATTLTSLAVPWRFGGGASVGVGLLADGLCYGFCLENFVGAASQGEIKLQFGPTTGPEEHFFPATEGLTLFPYPIRQPGVIARLFGYYRTSTGAADKVDIKMLTVSGQ